MCCGGGNDVENAIEMYINICFVIVVVGSYEEDVQCAGW